MQHKIDITKLGAQGQAMADAIQSCVHCGFCLAACPTYRLLGEEMDSPRGRIYLMKHVLEGELPAAEADPYLDRCLGCVGCVPACPSGVAYGELLMGYRWWRKAERQRPLPQAAARKLIVETLPYPTRFRTAVRTGKIGRFTQRFLPEPFASMLTLLPANLPPSPPLPAVYPAQGVRRARVALLTGCVQHVLAPQINWATLRVLAANGVETLIPAGQGCCGSILMHSGEKSAAQKLARQNLAVFPADVDAILTNAAGCGSGMKEYGLLFAGEAELDAAQSFARQVQDIAQFLQHLGFVTPPGFAEPVRLVYQDACHLRHAQGVVQPPRQLLQAIPHVQLVELPDEGLCCGSAGIYNLEQPDIARQLGQRKADLIVAAQAAGVVSGNIGCLQQIRTYLPAHVPMLHTLELLDMAYGQEKRRPFGE